MPLGPVSSTWSRGDRAPVHGFKVSFPSGFRGPQDIFLHKGPMPWAEGQQGSPRSRAPCSACLVEHERQAQVFLVVPLAEGPSLLPRGSMCQSLRTRPGKGGRTDRHALQRAGSGEAHVPGTALSGRSGGFHCGCLVPTARLSLPQPARR